MLNTVLSRKVMFFSLISISNALPLMAKAGLPISFPEADSTLPIRMSAPAVNRIIPATKPGINLNRQAQEFTLSYLRKNAIMLDAVKERSKAYFDIMDSVFTRHGIPPEVKYLAIVESQLKPRIRSRAGAVGAWQLMPATARTFALKVTKYQDDRTNFYKSTVAAAKYLVYLYKKFDDWLLVMAAYNGGPGTVYKAIKRSGSRNFWTMQQHLPKETRAHVKKFISTHYYFEQAGSIVTQSRDERIKHVAAVETWEKDQLAIAALCEVQE